MVFDLGASGINLLGGDTVQIHVTAPNGTTYVRAATDVDADADTVTYEVASGDFRVAGDWLCQLRIASTGIVIRTEPVILEVGKPLAGE
jgi:hypothetical protein